MRARRLLFPCASAVFLLAIPFVAFVFLDITASHSRIAMDALGISRERGHASAHIAPHAGRRRHRRTGRARAHAFQERLDPLAGCPAGGEA